MDELTIGDKIYISSKRAAEITGYAKDYVGQLCREGKVEATLVGRSWYVLEDSIRAHRFGTTEDSQTVVSGDRDSWEPAQYSPEPQEIIITTPELKTGEPDKPSLEDMQQAWKEWFERREVQRPSVPEDEGQLGGSETLEVPDEATHVSEDISEELETTEAPSEPHIDEQPSQETEDVAPVKINRSNPDEWVGVRVHETAVVSPEYFDIPATEIVVEPEEEESAPLFTADKHVDQTPYVESTTASRGRSKGRSAMRRGVVVSSNLPLKALLVVVSGTALAIAVVGSGYLDAYLRQASEKSGVIQYLVGTRYIE